ncbi:MAG: hypothetical protein ACKVT0_09875 [Planctomycetaceae bacterium]
MSTNHQARAVQTVSRDAQGFRSGASLLASLLIVLCVIIGVIAECQGDDDDKHAIERRAIAELVKRGAIVKRFEQRATGIEGLLVRLGDDYGIDRRIIHEVGTVDPEVIDLLRDLPELTLEIRGTTLSDAGLESLCGLSDLQGLDVSGSQISDEGVEHLNSLTKLVLIDLSLTQVSDAGIARLKPQDRLGTLSLQGTQVTEMSLEHLLDFSGLKSVYLPSQFTPHSRTYFVRKIPGCRVQIEVRQPQE